MNGTDQIKYENDLVITNILERNSSSVVGGKPTLLIQQKHDTWGRPIFFRHHNENLKSNWRRVPRRLQRIVQNSEQIIGDHEFEAF